MKANASKSLMALSFSRILEIAMLERNVKKIEKKFKKGIALFHVFEYNVEDVCKGDEVADCSLAGEVTVTDHVRESDDGSRTPSCRAKKPSSRT